MSYVLTVGLNPALQRVLTFPRLSVNGVNRAAGAALLASGKGINVARTLSLLGHRVVATGLLGGPSGAAIEAELKREGIPSAFTSIAAPTRQCVTIEDRARRTTTELIEPSPAVLDGELDRWTHAYESLAAWARFIVISGTVPEGTPPALYRRLVAFARRQQKQVMLDCGDDLWREGAAAEPDVLKCNEEELRGALRARRLAPSRLVRAARERARGGTRWVVVTRGAEPALFVCQCRSGLSASAPSELWRTRRSLSEGGPPATEVNAPARPDKSGPDSSAGAPRGAKAEGPSHTRVWWATPPRVRPVNTVGSGDAATAGMVAALLEGAPPEEVVRRAVACGTANALVSGPGVVRPADVKRLMADVRIRPV